MNKYYIYWSEDRRSNLKRPSVWNCVITGSAVESDLEIFKEYHNVINSITSNRVKIGWVRNRNNETVDMFVSNQNFYNDLIENNVWNDFSKFEYDNSGFQVLKERIVEFIDYFNTLRGSFYDQFINEVLYMLENSFFGPHNKAFINMEHVKEGFAKIQSSENESKRKRKQHISKKEDNDLQNELQIEN